MNSTTMNHRPQRILYAAGPGNVLGTYQHWKDGKDDPSQISMTYSGQFYDLCKELDAKGYAIACCPEKAHYEDDQFKIEHRPIPLQQASTLLYHLGYIWYGLGLVLSALLWRADTAVISNGSTHWFVLLPLHILGVKVVPTLHCVLWPKYQPRKKSQDLIFALDSHLLSRCSMIVASKDIADQVQEIVDTPQKPIVEFLPTYRRRMFTNVTAPSGDRSPFRLMFIGRIERDKGVFDLLEILKRFQANGITDITFDVCGKGTALDELRQAVTEAKLNEVFRCHGYCNQDDLQSFLSQSHCVIVPTTTSFIEGFNQVVAEGILAGRPVITSSVCPALDYVRDAVVEVPPDDIDAYYTAILKLRDDVDYYERLRQKSLELQGQFYDPSLGWHNILKSVLTDSQNYSQPMHTPKPALPAESG